MDVKARGSLTGSSHRPPLPAREVPLKTDVKVNGSLTGSSQRPPVPAREVPLKMDCESQRFPNRLKPAAAVASLAGEIPIKMDVKVSGFLTGSGHRPPLPAREVPLKTDVKVKRAAAVAS